MERPIPNVIKKIYLGKKHNTFVSMPLVSEKKISHPGSYLTLFFPMFIFDPPENIRKHSVF